MNPRVVFPFARSVFASALLLIPLTAGDARSQTGDGGGEVERYELLSATESAAQTRRLDPTGRRAEFSLGFEPTTGAALTVVEVTGTGLTEGAFDNLPQGARVDLPFEGKVYPFMVDYFGGDGNDLVLEWGNVRLMSWGRNLYGQLGDGTRTDRDSPRPLSADGGLGGALPLEVAAGDDLFSLALSADGRVFSWGEGSNNRLGRDAGIGTSVPGPVNQRDELAGKTVIAVAAVRDHSLVLNSDGSVAVWGSMGFGSPNLRAPTLVDSGVLADKRAVAVAAGGQFNLVLCADGTLASWGRNAYGALGTGEDADSPVPTAVDQSGVLADRTVVAIDAGERHCLALCDDGVVVAWGFNGTGGSFLNGDGLLGDGTTVNSNVPVLVDRSGVLARKTVVAIAAGRTHSMALCADGTLAAWGGNDSGRLGIGSSGSHRAVPMRVDQSGVLFRKRVVAIEAGNHHSLAICADGTMAAWGGNPDGQLGDGDDTRESSNVPVRVSDSRLNPGERFIPGAAAGSHNLVRVATPPAPAATTLPAAGIGDGAATLRARVNPQDREAEVYFEFGTTPELGHRRAAVPESLLGGRFTGVSLVLDGLRPGTTYYYRVVATSERGTGEGEILTFSTTEALKLADISSETGSLYPAFRGDRTRYDVTVPPDVARFRFTASAADPTVSVSVDGQAPATGMLETEVALEPGINRLEITVTPNGAAESVLVYRLSVLRWPEVVSFASADEPAAEMEAFDPRGSRASFALDFAPGVGTELTVVRQTGDRPAVGEFENLAQGETISLTHGGIVYRFVADYFGGDGNDVLLRWADQRVFGWGDNTSGQLGDGTNAGRSVPAPIDPDGLLAGRPLRDIAAGDGFSVALLIDGRMAAWGTNENGQLGNGGLTSADRPVWVDDQGVLAGKTVLDIAVGGRHVLALCADGTLAAWGDGGAGQLGIGGRDSSPAPVRVDQRGVLAGRRVVALAAGDAHNLVLCADGSLVWWGQNPEGTDAAPTIVEERPRLLDPGDMLAGESVVEIVSGLEHNLALTADGSLFSWGGSRNGALGRAVGSSLNVPAPVDMTSVNRPRVTAIAAGGRSNLVLADDGRLIQWGGSATSGPPEFVEVTDALSGRPIERIAIWSEYRLASTAENTLVAWEDGVGSSSDREPTAVDLSALNAAERLGPIAVGSGHFHLVADSPPAADVTTLPATDIADTRAVLRAGVRANGGDAEVFFEYGPTKAMEEIAAASPGRVGGLEEVEARAEIDGLVAGVEYHYRVVVTGDGGTVRGETRTFTTTELTLLAELSPSEGSLTPGFDPRINEYSMTVPFAADSITLSPRANNPESVVRVGGEVVAPGEAGARQPLAVGNTTVVAEVETPGGGNSTAYRIAVTRLPEVVSLDGGDLPPLSVASLTPGGNPLPLALNFAPPTGAHFTLVEVTGSEPISGAFANLGQGETVVLEHQGVGYGFVVNYRGGDGNDLVLHWANTRLVAWGDNSSGQLGTGESGAREDEPVSVDQSGILAGKAVIEVAAGSEHSLALSVDGRVASWGRGSSGRLGRGPEFSSFASSAVPVPVYRGGVLAERAVIALGAGNSHSVTLTADGALAAWGANELQLASAGGERNSSSPLLVELTEVLAGKRITAISTRRGVNLAIRGDGRVIAWGINTAGQLGRGDKQQTESPVLVDTSGVLAGKRVVSVAAGRTFALALTEDGTPVAWGSNRNGQVGTGDPPSGSPLDVIPNPPAAVDRTGVLSGKTVVDIAAGDNHALALCGDGTLVAWGENRNGQLGDGTTTDRRVPVRVDRSGVLGGKRIVEIAAGGADSFALCEDGTVVVWGSGFDFSAENPVPRELDLSVLGPGERVIGLDGGGSHALAVVGAPPPPRHVETLAAGSITDTSATLRGRASGNGSVAAVRIEYGTTPELGNAMTAQPAEVSGTAVTDVAANLDDLQPGTTYHYRLVAENDSGSVAGETATFTTTTLTDLAGLSFDRGSLTPEFAPSRLDYHATLPAEVSEIRVTATPFDPAATLTVAGAPASGEALVPLSSAATTIPVTVTSADSANTRVYRITATRLPESMDLTADPQPVVRAGGFSLDGDPPAFTLGRAPVPGMPLPVLENTGVGRIAGRFDGLSQGQTLILSHGGAEFPFVVNYFGGDGNDLVLEWANARLFSWGENGSGQLGDGTAADRLAPSPVSARGALAGQTIVDGGSGTGHTAVLGAEGGLFAWGSNSAGRLGTGDFGTNSNSLLPMAVDQTGVLRDQTIVALSVGGGHNLALGADGRVFGWGANRRGELGDGGDDNRIAPVATDMSGVLAGKRVVAVAAGGNHSLALCDDGTLVAWGSNGSGQLGNGGTTGFSAVPVAVDQTGFLRDKEVIAIAAGGNGSSYALCADGTVAAWGDNFMGQLGDGGTSSRPVPGTSSRPVPAAVDLGGVLEEKTVVAIAPGAAHVLALCADGTLAAWGANSSGQLGDGSRSGRSAPVLVDRSGLSAGKIVRSIHAAGARSFAFFEDGTFAAWGNNFSGGLGTGGTDEARAPVMADLGNLRAGERVSGLLTGPSAANGLALVAAPAPPRATTLAAADVGDVGATLRGSVNANGETTEISFEYGLTPDYGFTAAAEPATLDGAAPVSAAVADLRPLTTYHFRVVVEGPGGTAFGADQTFTTTGFATLAGLELDAAGFEPAFDPSVTRYVAVVPGETGRVRVTPVAADAAADVAVNGAPVASGSASAPIDLAFGDTGIRITVTAGDGAASVEYRLTVTRVPETFTYGSAGGAGLRAPFFSGSGMTADFALEFAPSPGTGLGVVELPGIRPIRTEFDNLAHGDELALEYDGVIYRFVANYFGGDGNDLVLEWGDTVLDGWGANDDGQLGDGTTQNAAEAIRVDFSGALAGKTIVSVASGFRHSLALCSDGTLAAWGWNDDGQLGDGTRISRDQPVRVDQGGALAGKTVVAITAGNSHNLALCADGSLFSWGSGRFGILGAGDGVSGSPVPVPVVSTGVLADKRPVAISCAGLNNLVLCEDGSLVAWGRNSNGQLGIPELGRGWVDEPRAVDGSGALADRSVVQIATGPVQTMVRCADGAVVAWGNHEANLWDLGRKSTDTPTLVPAVGEFAGRTVMDISLGRSHGLALCDDQTIIAWGEGRYGRLGNGGTQTPEAPVTVDRSGILADREVVGVIARNSQSFAVCADGRVAAWGFNGRGELGDGTNSQSSVPVWVGDGGFASSAAPVALSEGIGGHSLQIGGGSPSPRVTTLAASGVADQNATLRAEVTPNGGEAGVVFELGATPDFGRTLPAKPLSVDGMQTLGVTALAEDLLPGTTYYYRAVAFRAGVLRFGETRTFTTGAESVLTGLGLEGSALIPDFSGKRFNYSATVSGGTGEIRVSPVAERAGATLRVNGSPVVSGDSGPPVALEVGLNEIDVEVSSADGSVTSIYRIAVTRLPKTFAIDSPAHEPVVAEGMRATGVSLPLGLNFAPPAGTDIPLVKITGDEPIRGNFDNLVQGRTITLDHEGIAYPFVVNYRGGRGADLVLEWANHRVLAWGWNSRFQLGDQSRVSRESPVDAAIPRGGVRQLESGDNHGMALYGDGTLWSWGANDRGQLGRAADTGNFPPEKLDASEAFAGKTIAAIAAGHEHSLALAVDGTVFAWGGNDFGQVGDGTRENRFFPTEVGTMGALAEKHVIAITAGWKHSFALCADGTLVAWGLNSASQFGNGGTGNSMVPVAVEPSGALAGKRVTAIAAGFLHGVALCEDGTLAAWGANDSGQLGTGDNRASPRPVAVTTDGALAGKTVVEVSAGARHSLARADDGTVFAWGRNSFGVLGINRPGDQNEPVAVFAEGALAGKTVTGIDAGPFRDAGHGLAWTADGSMLAWGTNSAGQLGNSGLDGSNSDEPVLVDDAALDSGQLFSAGSGGGQHSLGRVAMPPAPIAGTLAAESVSETAATVRARVNRNGRDAEVRFEYGRTPDYGNSISATPATLESVGETEVSAVLEDLEPGTTYHFRVVATSTGGTVHGGDVTFTTGSRTLLADLAADVGSLVPAFDPRRGNYALTVPHTVSSVSLTADLFDPASELVIGDRGASPGSAAGPFPLEIGNQVISLAVTAADGSSSQVYQLTVTRLPAGLTLDASGDSAALTVPGLAAEGGPLPLSLEDAPPIGTGFSVIEVTGADPIQGRFEGLEQGGRITLGHGGIDYEFVVDYHGGDGNDLVLHWANVRLVAWGEGDSGKIGDGNTVNRPELTPVDDTGALAGRAVIALSAGGDHSLALCADGTVVAWGGNSSGQLGDGTFESGTVPVEVRADGALAGKRVIDVAAGSLHSLALCADGSVVAWGGNGLEQLGDGTRTASPVPVAVRFEGPLSGKRVVGVAAGHNHNLAVCDDGSVVGWGDDGFLKLGTGFFRGGLPPQSIDMTAAHGQTRIVSVAAGESFSIALDAEGVVSTWGGNDRRQLGDEDADAARAIPAAIDESGALAGRRVTAIQAGYAHGLALAADGAMVAWGSNFLGVLGIGNDSFDEPPVLVRPTFGFEGKPVMRIRAGNRHNYALAADGTLAAWGENRRGQLADGAFGDRSMPSVALTHGLAGGERIIGVAGGAASDHGLGLVAMPPPPVAETLAAGEVGDTGATLRARVDPEGRPASVVFEYGPTPAYGFTVPASSSPLSGVTPTETSARLSGLLSGTTYHFRVVASGSGGTVAGEDRTVTTGSGVALAGLEVGPGELHPAFSARQTDYAVTLPAGSSSVAVVPTAASADAVIRVNGQAVASGSASPPVPLETGENDIAVEVVSSAGDHRQIYQLRVFRLPPSFEFASARDGTLAAESFVASGDLPVVNLLHSPQPGTGLVLVRKAGTAPIAGEFDNLAQGEIVRIDRDGRTYSFVANYFGGDGNDLVLQWANIRPYAFGYNGQGQLGNGGRQDSGVPAAVNVGGALRGRTILSSSGRGGHFLSVLEDGSVLAWGRNIVGQLGDGTRAWRAEPTPVEDSGVLAGRKVVAVAAGNSHSLALCADGTVASWGRNDHGQLGDGSGETRPEPVAVDFSGVPGAGRIEAIAAGGEHGLALDSNGGVFAWGRNTRGQLGDGSDRDRMRPVRIGRQGVLAGKTVTGLAAGGEHSLAQCADGSLAAWGANDRGQLGDNGTFDSDVPVRVRQGDLEGRSVVGLAVGTRHNLARRADGTMVAWGDNSGGQLGLGGTADARVPTAVPTAKPVVDLAAGAEHSLAVFEGGRVSTWGRYRDGSLGTGTGKSTEVPTPITAGELPDNARSVRGTLGDRTSLLLAALPPRPVATTAEASDVGDSGATLNASIKANGPDAEVVFEFGTAPDFLDSRIAATPSAVTDDGHSAVAARLEGLPPGSEFHYRAVAANENGEGLGAIQRLTTTTSAALAGLSLSDGELGPEFDPAIADYLATVDHGTATLSLTPVAFEPGAAIAVGGEPVASGSASRPIPLGVGENLVRVEVTSQDGEDSLIYQIRVNRLADALTLDSASGSLLTAERFSAAGIRLGFELGFAPAPGQRIRVLTLTGAEPLAGSFENMNHGEIVEIDHNGSTFRYVVDYFGGNGNDVELKWLNSRVVGWGRNNNGQLGDGNTKSFGGVLLPTPVEMNGALHRRPVLGIGGSSGFFGSFSVARLAAGGLAGWGKGMDVFGEATPDSLVPEIIDLAGSLRGKSLASVSAGSDYFLMLATDGTPAALGRNSDGALGDGTFVSSASPVAVSTDGALRGKRVVAMSAGDRHSLALCLDGTVVAWGRNDRGQLGQEAGPSRSKPQVVEGLPEDADVIAVEASNILSFALLDDGRIFSWGGGGGEVPAEIDSSGPMAGKHIVALSAGKNHMLALSDGGRVYAWGNNDRGQLGNGTTESSPVPVEVSRQEALDWTFITAISATVSNSFALSAEGELFSWGDDSSVLGSETSADALVPIPVSTANLRMDEAFTGLAAGMEAFHLHATTALPLPAAEPLAADAITGVSATLRGLVDARDNETSVTVEYGVDESFGATVTASPDTVSGSGETQVGAAVDGLTPGTRYVYRVVAESYGGIIRSPAMSFTTLSDNAHLTALDGNFPARVPGFGREVFHGFASVPFGTDEIRLTPVTEHPAATVEIEGVPVASGEAGPPLSLAVGNTTFTTVVTAEDGITTLTYTTTVTRLPEVFALDGSGGAPVVAAGFAAPPIDVDLALGFHPPTGTNLPVVENTGLAPISGEFGNLTQGQRITLSFEGVDYDFVANYHGGTGNDLALHWADTEVYGWGLNSHGQLGEGTTENRQAMTPAIAGGPLDGATVFDVAAGYLHSVAVLSNGTVAAWGFGALGQLGDGTTDGAAVPTGVRGDGALAGKTVIAVDAGSFHSLALCADGSLVSWGYNNHGQLGDGSTTQSDVPVAVRMEGALAGKRVVAITAGSYHNVVLCADGTLAAWGYNDEGVLGDGTTARRAEPVAVDASDVLAGKQVAAIHAGQFHTLAVTTDGTLVSWGYNDRGQLGDGTTTDRHSPVGITGSGALDGKTLVAVEAGGMHSVAVCDDGSLVGWGSNRYNQLGSEFGAGSATPVAIPANGDRAAGGAFHTLSLERVSGTVTAWGRNHQAQLGRGVTSPDGVAAPADAAALPAGARPVLARSGAAALHNLAVIALPASRRADDSSDPGDGEGLAPGDEAMAYAAFGLEVGASQLPRPVLEDGHLVVRFGHDEVADGFEVGAEWSETLEPGSWQTLPDVGAGDFHEFRMPVDDYPAGFIRLRATSAD